MGGLIIAHLPATAESGKDPKFLRRVLILLDRREGGVDPPQQLPPQIPSYFENPDATDGVSPSWGGRGRLPPT